MRTSHALVLLAVAFFGHTSAAQDRATADRNRFRSGIEVISITVTVRDGEGRLVQGLAQDAFEVYEDGERQTITQFTHERVPLSLALLLDVSDSMFGQRLRDAHAAVQRFLFDLLDPADEFSVQTFNHIPHILTEWTRDHTLVSAALDGLLPFGGTAIYDAVMTSLPFMDSRSQQRAALLVISDGADTASDATLRDVRSALLRSDAFAYAIAVDSPDTRAINTRVNPMTLREVTDASGGRTEIVQSTADLFAATSRIAEELNSQYVLGYSSPRPLDGQYHSIRVRVARPGYRVQARSGYVAEPRATTTPRQSIAR